MLNPAEIWESDRLPDRLLRWGLIPGSWLYALGWEAYLSIYRLGLKRAQAPHPRVVVVGNLMVGGSGKSPVARHVAEVLGRRRPVVLGCNGYGSPHQQGASLAPAGPLAAAEWGDEPAMLRWFLPNVPLVVGRDRVAAARLAFEASPESVLVMDDGFQHLPLRHDLGLVLDPARPKNGHCLPAGPYREPRFERKRADLVIGAGSRFEVARRPLSFVSGVTGEKVALEAADVLCALGRPQGFVADLERVGVRLGERRLLPDHDPLTAGTLLEGLSSPWVVVTAKDWVKLRSRGDLDLSRIVVALQQVTVEPAAEFEAFVWQRIPS